jgi:hypothetical protein
MSRTRKPVHDPTSRPGVHLPPRYFNEIPARQSTCHNVITYHIKQFGVAAGQLATFAPAPRDRVAAARHPSRAVIRLDPHEPLFFWPSLGFSLALQPS